MKSKKPSGAATKRPAKRAQPARVESATIELTRGQAYALLAGASAAIEAGVEPPEAMHRSLCEAVTKFRRAFKFKPGDKS